jgi:hypothetical protein
MLLKTNQTKVEQQMLSNISTVNDRQTASFPTSLPISSANQTSETNRGNSMIYEDKVAISALLILVVLGIIVSLIW